MPIENSPADAFRDADQPADDEATVASRAHFGDELIQRARALGHPLCVGLDPHLAHLPDLFRRGTMHADDPETCQAVEHFLFEILDLLAERVAVVKPQSAFFEQLGWRGMRLLEAVARRAGERRLLVLIDAKRGDIGSTAAAYADAFLGRRAPFPADALTLNPYLGSDALQPFLDRAKKHGRGLFVLVKTSNPGARDLQDLAVSAETGAATLPVYGVVARLLAGPAARLRGPATGWSALGAVVGATYPDDAERLRELLPDSLFLVPGYGAQGGSARDAVRGFRRGPHGGLEGGLVSSSRGILFPPQAASASDLCGWRQSIDQALTGAIDELAAAVAG